MANNITQNNEKKTKKIKEAVVQCTTSSPTAALYQHLLVYPHSLYVATLWQPHVGRQFTLF